MKTHLLIISLSFLLIPIASFAAYNDVTMDTSVTITVGSINLSIGGSARFDSIEVSGGSFSMVMSDGAQINVTSPDRRRFTVEPSQYAESFTCNGDNSVWVVRNVGNSSAVTVTVTPSSTVCSGSGSTSGGGGIISGGGGASAPTVPAQTAAIAAAISPAPAVSAPVAVISPAPSLMAISVSPVFTKVLKLGTSGADVKRLQQVLNSDPDTQIAESGVGSSGNETEYFGSATRKALQKFQEKYSIVSSGDEATTGYGALGPKTRAKLAEVFAKATPTAPLVAQPSVVAVSVSPVFTSGLSRGMTSSDVKRLQQLLNSDPDTKIAESGTGSLGNETEYFGSLTEKAVQKFQVKYGIAKEGEPGYGYIGPKTRAKIQEVFKQQ